MIALAVLSVVLTVTAAATGQSIRADTWTRNQGVVLERSRSIVEEIQATPFENVYENWRFRTFHVPDLPPCEVEGFGSIGIDDIEDDLLGDITELPVGVAMIPSDVDPDADLIPIVISITWQEESGPREYRFTYIRIDPEKVN